MESMTRIVRHEVASITVTLYGITVADLSDYEIFELASKKYQEQFSDQGFSYLKEPKIQRNTAHRRARVEFVLRKRLPPLP